MPTLLRIDGLRVVIYPNDHPPPHVHIVGAEVKASLFLNCPEGPASGRDVIALTRGQLGRVEAVLNQNIRELCEVWSEYHGDF